ncbi:MAG: GNAT family N-acetyltransferase [Myxococcales bacterium]|nr:GNAT family N-acetyltransferase [Myxococcales bacterium]
MSATVRTCVGDEVRALLPALAELRVRIFADYPYLYEGDEASEREYLKVYAESEGAIVVVAEDDGAIVGASTGLPLAHEPETLRAPFVAAGLDVGSIFYGGESVLSPSHRGQRIYGRFLAAREGHARDHGFSTLTFCAVQRPADHPARPPGYVPLDAVWQHFGYVPRPDLRATMRWRDHGEPEETEKPMTFWTKAL